MKHKWLLSFACGALIAAAAPSFAQDPTELLRADLRAQKTAILTKALALDDTQSTAFWPIYREYESALVKINDETMSMIKDYATNYESMNNEVAKDLLKRAFKVREGRTKLLKKYTGKVEKSVSPIVAARWAQAEHAIQSAIDLQLASELPLMK
jgi:hypothetical protein